MNSKYWYLVIISLFYSCNKEHVEDPLKDFNSMSYDIENKIIYGIGYDPEGVIFEYELKNIVG